MTRTTVNKAPRRMLESHRTKLAFTHHQKQMTQTNIYKGKSQARSQDEHKHGDCP